MLFDFLFCCSKSTLKETKTVNFENKIIKEEKTNQNDIITPYMNMDNNLESNSKDNIVNNESNNDINNPNNSIKYNINNISHLVNNVNNINLINNSNFYARGSSNQLGNNKMPFINAISSKSSFKSLLIKNYNSQNNLNNFNMNFQNKFKINGNINNVGNFQNNLNNNNINNNLNNNLNNNINNNINNNLNNNLNSSDFQKANSILSFSNLVVAKTKTNNNNDDTEILSPYELLLSGDIFFNKEIKIDRLGIKSNKIGDKRMRKEHLIKFGILINSKQNSDYNTSDIKCKIEKESEKYSQNKVEMNSLSSFQIKGKDHNLDMLLNIEPEKVKKLLDKYEQIIAIEHKEEEDLSSPKVRKENKAIALFTIRYIASMELFEFCSTHNTIPIELLLDHEYQLRNGYDYNVKLGEVVVILKVLKNINDEDILKIKIKYNDDENNANEKNNKNRKQEYNFNSSNDVNKYISIGRRNCTININDDSVSNTHLKIRYSNNTDTFSVIDGGSQNGSYLLLNEPFNFIYIKNTLSFRFFESKFVIKFLHNSE